MPTIITSSNCGCHLGKFLIGVRQVFDLNFFFPCGLTGSYNKLKIIIVVVVVVVLNLFIVVYVMDP